MARFHRETKKKNRLEGALQTYRQSQRQKIVDSYARRGVNRYRATHSLCFYFGLSVCLSVRRITEKVVNGFWRNFLEGRAWSRDQWVQFWWRSGSSSGSRSPKSQIRIHCIIELPTDFDEILWTAGVWPRDQLNTFWWRSASLSGSGSPFRITICEIRHQNRN